jgi:hypothetical protein|tara:strand:- start:5788 stop:5940 length:153 start_codon:yes stop_codon:yes gene_type:complete
MKDFILKPEANKPVLDASEWPLLLKNYDKMMVSVTVMMIDSRLKSPTNCS